MTLRIDLLPAGPRLAVRLAGRMRRENLPDLERHMGSGRVPVVLELADVTLVDVDAVRFLRDAEASGVELSHCPAFVRAWIDMERGGDA